MESLLEKIPPEKCWALTAKIITAFFVMRGEKIIAPALGKDDGIIAPVLGAEKWKEINVHYIAEGGRKMISMVNERFNIPVEDAIGAAKLVIVAATLLMGPETQFEIVEATREKAVVRWTKCAWWERYKEFEVDPAFIPCEPIHQAYVESGLKAINPKITYKVTTARQRGYTYCEDIYEFKER